MARPSSDLGRAKAIIKLARREFPLGLRTRELRIIVASCSPGTGQDSEETISYEPFPDVVTRPEFVRWLLTDPEVIPLLDIDGLQLSGAFISGILDLDACKVPFGLTFESCYFHGSISLRDGSVQSVYLARSIIEGDIDASNCTITRDLDIREVTIVNGGLRLDHAVCAGSVSLTPSFVCSRTVSMVGIQIESGLSLKGAKILSTKGDALDLDQAHIKADIKLEPQINDDGSFTRFECRGGVQADAAQIGGDFRAAGATVNNLSCQRSKIAGIFYWTAIEHTKELTLNLTGTTVDSILDDRSSWPEPGWLFINNLAYRDLDLIDEAPTLEETLELAQAAIARFDVDSRIEWLYRQNSDEVVFSSSWMQLSNLCLTKGDSEGAKKVLYIFRRIQARKRWFVSRGWSLAIDKVDQDPFSILFPITALWLIAFVVFRRAKLIGAMAPTDADAYFKFKGGSLPDHYGPFEPSIYALENVLPVIKLGQDGAWAPDPKFISSAGTPTSSSRLQRLMPTLSYPLLRALRWTIILLGWLLALILVGAIGSRFKA